MNGQPNLKSPTGLKLTFWQLAALVAIVMLAGALLTGKAGKIDAVEAVAAPVTAAAGDQTAAGPSGSAATVTVACSYDAAGRLIKVEYGDGKGSRYQYDKSGNLIRRQSY